MTSADIERAVAGRHPHALWHPLKRAVTLRSTNVVGHEADILVVSEQRYATEIEIKVSKQDLVREFVDGSKKWKHEKFDKAIKLYVRRFFVAVPVELQDAALEIVPEKYGVIVVHPSTTKRPGTPVIVRQAKVMPAQKLSDMQIIKLYKKFYFERWNKAQ